MSEVAGCSKNLNKQVVMSAKVKCKAMLSEVLELERITAINRSATFNWFLSQSSKDWDDLIEV